MHDGVDAVHERRDLLEVGEIGEAQLPPRRRLIRIAPVEDELVGLRQRAGQMGADPSGRSGDQDSSSNGVPRHVPSMGPVASVTQA